MFEHKLFQPARSVERRAFLLALRAILNNSEPTLRRRFQAVLTRFLNLASSAFHQGVPLVALTVRRGHASSYAAIMREQCRLPPPSQLVYEILGKIHEILSYP